MIFFKGNKVITLCNKIQKDNLTFLFLVMTNESHEKDLTASKTKLIGFVNQGQNHSFIMQFA
jgi:hypothetical protein